jgi:sulfite reductase alpha subunit-like flavoprotein
VEELGEESLEGMKLAVLTVGTSEKTMQLETLFKQKGAVMIVSSGEATDNSAVEKWLAGLWKSLNIAIRDVSEFTGQHRSLPAPSPPSSYLYSRLLSKRPLTESHSESKVVELSLDSGGHQPSAGSSVEIYADNDLAAVSEVIARFNFDANYSLESLILLHPSVRWRAELPFNVFDYLQRYVDFSSPVPVYFAHYFASHIRNIDQQSEFKRLISSIDTPTLPNPYSILHLLRTFPDIDYFSIEETMPLLPPLLSRHYAVASTPLVLPDSVNIAVEVNGVCSKYLEKLANLELNRPIFVKIGFSNDSETFWGPLCEASSPLLIAAGVGIAAFRGLLEQISLERRRPVRVFYACRQPVKGSEAHNCDFPYQDDIRGFVSLLGGKIRVITVAKGLDFESALLAALKEAGDELRQWAKAVGICGPLKTANLQSFLKEILPEVPILVSQWS